MRIVFLAIFSFLLLPIEARASRTAVEISHASTPLSKANPKPTLKFVAPPVARPDDSKSRSGRYILTLNRETGVATPKRISNVLKLVEELQNGVQNDLNKSGPQKAQEIEHLAHIEEKLKDTFLDMRRDFENVSGEIASHASLQSNPKIKEQIGFIKKSIDLLRRFEDPSDLDGVLTDSQRAGLTDLPRVIAAMQGLQARLNQINNSIRGSSASLAGVVSLPTRR